MDESTRRQFRKDLKEGHSPEAAGRRAGIGSEKARNEADQARGDDFRRTMADVLKPSASAGDIPFGAIGFVILCIVVASYAGAIVKAVLFAGLLALMLASFVTTFKGMWTMVQLIWLTAGSALFGAGIYALRGGASSPAMPSLLGLEFPGLATGAATGDALVMGFCLAMTVFAVPVLRDGLFRWMSGLGMTQALRVYVASRYANQPLRALALAFLLPLAAALFWTLSYWDFGGWPLRVMLGYGLILLAAALLWVWRLTMEPAIFGTYFGVVDTQAYRRAWEKYGRDQ